VQYARVSVRDNGHGITEEVQRRMFEPYFSTKKALGTGLGLATVLQTVRQFGGAIAVASQVGVGTEILVYLPMLRAVAAAGELNTSAEVLVAPGRERILIVDDEYPVRNVLSISLDHLGYEVETASSGAEALEKYRAAQQPYDLVILDMIMPQMPGDRVFAELAGLDPAVRVLVISGYSSEAAVQAILDNGGLDFMAKPFTIEELSRKVRQCLAAG
jgi:CheY-like chemotaxis protein